MWHPQLKTKLLGAVGFLALVGLGGLTLAHHWVAAQHFQRMVMSDIQARADMLAGLVNSHLRAVAIHQQREELAVRRDLDILAGVYLGLCRTAHASEQRGDITRAQAQERVRRALLGQRIGPAGYPFVWDVSRAPEVIPLAVHPKLQGADVAHVDFVRRGAAMKRGFLEYRWANPDDEHAQDKVAALEYFEPWQWVICASAYKHEFPQLVDQSFYQDADQALAAQVTSLKVGERGYAFVLDRQGEVVMHPRGAQAHGEPEPLLAEARTRGDAVWRLRQDGHDWLLASRRLAPLGWVVVKAREDDFLAPVLSGLRDWSFMVLAGLLVLTALVLVPLLGRLVINPARRLAEVADRIAGGMLDGEPVRVAGGDEMAHLAGSLNAMSTRLRDSMAYLAQSERRYRDLFNNSPEPGYVISRAGFFMDINPAMERVLGRGRSEVHGLHFSEFIAERQAEDIERMMAEAARLAQPLTDLGFTVRDRAGRPRFLEGFLTPLMEPGGRLSGFYGLARDLTEQRQLREQLLQAQKMEILGTLAGGIAHDFNNLLSGILGYSSLMLGDPSLDPRLRRYLRIIDDSAAKAAEITQQLLSLAKVGSSSKGAVDLNSVVRDVLTILEHSFQPRVQVVVSLDEGLPAVEADAGQLHQALMNLCINARDAMPEGGSLTLETGLGELEPGQRAVVVSVADSGQGMDEEVRRQALEPFFTTKEHGTGLGLPMVLGIVKGHGGRLEIDSRPGLGTTARLLLPPGRAGLELPGPHQPQGLIPGQETVLVVDDEETVRDLAVEVLSLAGYQALAAAEGEQALQVLARPGASVDLVLLDLVMPGLNGLDLLAHIKQRHPGVKVILVSGMYDAREEARPQWRQAEAFLPKPYRAPALLALARRILDAPAGAGEGGGETS